MRGPTDTFADLGITDRYLCEAGVSLPDIERECDLALSRHGLQRQSTELLGHHLIIPIWDRGAIVGRKRLERSRLYSAATADEALAAVRVHIAAIAERHGPGRVWFLMEPVHAIKDDGMIAAGKIGGVDHLVFRTLYGHEAQAVVE